MNELRMYVEHLFEGKVLTPENIELKEEIYGNLVARYEDLIAEGVSEEEALERTKQSMSSLDEIDEDVASDDPSAISSVVAQAEGATQVDGVAQAEESVQPDETLASGTKVMPVSNFEISGEQTAPDSQPEKTLDTGKVLKYGLIAFAVIVLLGIGAKLLLGCVDEAVEHGKDQASVVQVDPSSSPQGNSNPQGADANAADNAITVDENGRVWMEGEPGDELLAAVVGATYSDATPYVDTKLEDAATVETLLHTLPLGDLATDIDVTKGSGVLSLAYREVPEAYDDDSVDVALAYNVAVLFSTMPLVNEIQVTVAEQGEPMDESYYVFTRDDVQGAYGVMLSREMVNESGWRQIKDDHLYARKFAERLVEKAEREWR